MKIDFNKLYDRLESQWELRSSGNISYTFTLNYSSLLWGRLEVLLNKNSRLVMASSGNPEAIYELYMGVDLEEVAKDY